jgi:hypothetical protein
MEETPGKLRTGTRITRSNKRDILSSHVEPNVETRVLYDGSSGGVLSKHAQRPKKCCVVTVADVALRVYCLTVATYIKAELAF